MRIAIHDFSGHPFQVQLSRELASRGHNVLHLHFPGFQSPKGALQPAETDPPTFQIRPVTIGRPYNKYSPVRRMLADRLYASNCASLVREFRADVMLSGNATPFAQNWLRQHCQRSGIRFIAWIQDLYGHAVRSALKRKLGALGDMAGLVFRRLDRSLIERSDGVIFIAEEFCDEYRDSRPSSRGAWHVIENWAPLADLPPRPKVNAWSCRQGLSDKRVFLYSGTLGFKHNPELLVELARRFRDVPDVVVVVISQGMGRDHLDQRKRELSLTNLRLFDFQPFEDVPDVMGSADVLISIIESEAGAFSVPSKVLTYLCAGRPLLLSVPADNLAARIVSKNQTGLVVGPDDAEGFFEAAGELIGNPEYAACLASRARQYASATFDIDQIATRFENVFRQTLAGHHPQVLL